MLGWHEVNYLSVAAAASPAEWTPARVASALRGRAAAFAATVQATWKGREEDVFWLAPSPFVPAAAAGADLSFWQRTLSFFPPMVQVLGETFCATEIQTLNLWAAYSNPRATDMYSDGVHYKPNLYLLPWWLVLDKFCQK